VQVEEGAGIEEADVVFLWREESDFGLVLSRAS
jgi:hypothetical protein